MPATEQPITQPSGLSDQEYAALIKRYVAELNELLRESYERDIIVDIQPNRWMDGPIRAVEQSHLRVTISQRM